MDAPAATGCRDEPMRSIPHLHESEIRRSQPEQENLSPTAAQDFKGYRTPQWAGVLYAAFILLTGGLFWVVAYYLPWIPLWTLQACPLKVADQVLVQLVNGRYKLAKVIQHHDSRHHHSQSTTRSAPQRLIVLHLVVYIYDEVAGTFRQLPDMPAELPHQILQANAALHAMAAGASWNTFNSAAIWSRQTRARLYGANEVTAGRPSLTKMMWERMMQPMFVVQFVEIVLIFWEEDYKLAVLLQVVTLGANSIVIARLYQSRLKLYQSVSLRRLIPIVQAGRVRATTSNRLVPGDVIVVLPGKATCDMVLLRGSCLVEESLLSGEAAQVRKSSIGGLGSSGYHPNTHHAYTVHSGTTVEQVWNEEDAEEEVLAMVVRTGLHTSMGAMMRHVFHNATPSTPRFIKDYFIFCAFSLALQIAAFGIVIVRAQQAADDIEDAIERVIDLFIAAFPSIAPAVILFAVGVRIRRLSSQGIATLQPDKLDAAAHTEIVCFDKTGTLTANASDLHGMLPVAGGQFLSLQSDALRWPNSLKQAAALCNSLTLISKSQVVGELQERRAFKAVEARFLNRNVVSLPLQATQGRRTRQATMHILKRFEFEPSLMRSGVVAVEHHNDMCAAHGMLIVKGAAAVIEQMVGSDRLPPNYRKVVDEWSAQSFRVLAVASAEVRHVNRLSLGVMTQQEVEDRAGRLHLVGLIILSNSLNADSKDTVQQLQERGGLRLMMVTGDYYHTAIAVARGVGMVPARSRVVVLQTHAEQHGRLTRACPEQKKTVTPAAAPAAVAKAAAAKSHSMKAATAAKHSVPSAAADPAPERHKIPRGVSFAANVELGSSSSEDEQPQVETDDMHLLGSLPPYRSESASQQPAKTMPRDESPPHGHESGFPGLELSASKSHGLIEAGHMTALSEVPAGATGADGLAISLDNGDTYHEGDMQRAFRALSEGDLPCCVTGPAFEYLLQQPDASLLETVLLNSVAFTRMGAHQKGQLMDLLGAQGLHQICKGQRRHIPGLGKSCLYCGDGINDLAALTAADVGMAVGSAEASAAATFTDRHYSVAGVCTVLREGRALQVILVSIVKFMVLYQLADQMSVNSMFFVDNSNYSNDQSDAFDFIALAVGLVAALRPAASALFPQRRLPRLCHFYAYFSAAAAGVWWAVMYVAVLELLPHQPWYTGGNGSSDQNPVVTTIWCLCLVQVISPAIMFPIECYPYCKRANVPELVLVGALLIYMTLNCILSPGWYDANDIFKFFNLPFSFTFKMELICLVCVIGWLWLLAYVRRVMAWRDGRRIIGITNSDQSLIPIPSVTVVFVSSLGKAFLRLLGVK